VYNPTDGNVLLYDGEELAGAKQNRILNITVLVGTKSQTTIPVSCVEEGRWRYDSRLFTAGRHAAHPELRRRKNARLAAEPLARGLAQHEVWDEVSAKAGRLGVESKTGANADTFKARERDLAVLRKAFPLALGQCGAMLSLGDAVCLDYVSRPDAFAKLYEKLLDGYLLDAIEYRGPAVVDHGFFGRLDATSSARQPSAGLGQDLRLNGSGVVASGLELDGELLQVSAFSVGRQRPTRVARPTQRR
jgi:hypothetical protein